MDNRHTADSSDIWRAAIRSGWNTERTNMYQVMEHIKGYDLVRYYGNTLHWDMLETHPGNNLPFMIPSPLAEHLASNLGDFTKRQIHLTYYKPDMVNNSDRAFFIKPVREKYFEAKVYQPGEALKGSGIEGDEIYYSDVVKFINEVRCFCLDGKVYTSSYYRMDTQVWDITGLPPDQINFDKQLDKTPIPEMVKAITERCHFKHGICMDFGTNEKGEWSLVEFNETPFCGLYYMDYDKALEVIINSQIDIK